MLTIGSHFGKSRLASVTFGKVWFHTNESDGGNAGGKTQLRRLSLRGPKPFSINDRKKG